MDELEPQFVIKAVVSGRLDGDDSTQIQTSNFYTELKAALENIKNAGYILEYKIKGPSYE